MRDFAAEMRAEGKMRRSRQERIDKIMCRPGYSWNETIQKCLPPVGYGEKRPNRPNKPQPPTELPPIEADIQPAAGEAIAMEAYQRQSQGLLPKK